MRKIIFLLIFTINVFAFAQGQEIPVSIRKISMEGNPDGLGFGFWCNWRYNKEVFTDFGRRPYERHGFYSWSQIETSPNIYETDKIIKEVQQSHALGSNCIISFNSISGPWFIGTFKSQIPSFYTQDITDETTRNNGKKYIYTVIKKILPEVGELWVCFDYEMMWHCRPDTKEKQKIYRDWYLDAVAMARLAAKDLEMEANLKIMPIVNGSTEDKTVKILLNSPRKNHVPAQWLLDVVSVSDYLAIDSYDFDMGDRTNPAKTIETLGFWVKNYSLEKDVQITEFGYSSGNTPYPDYKTHYHACGTEEQQAAFYQNLFPALVEANQKGKALNGQVRSFQFWMYSDQETKKAAFERENHFGIIRMDNSHKPSFDVIKEGINRIENDKKTPLSRIKEEKTISVADLKKGLEMSYLSGTDYDYLTCSFHNAGKENYLYIRLTEKGSVLVEINGKWYYSLNPQKENLHKIKLYDAPENLIVKAYFPGGKFPLNQKVKQIYLSK